MKEIQYFDFPFAFWKIDILEIGLDFLPNCSSGWFYIIPKCQRSRIAYELIENGKILCFSLQLINESFIKFCKLVFKGSWKRNGKFNILASSHFSSYATLSFSLHHLPFWKFEVLKINLVCCSSEYFFLILVIPIWRK